MGHYVLIVQSEAKPGRGEEYARWYASEHLAHVCAIPGVKSGRRFEALPAVIGKSGSRYLAIYEIEAEDPHTVTAELQKRASEGTMNVSDALDRESVISWLYQAKP